MLLAFANPVSSVYVCVPQYEQSYRIYSSYYYIGTNFVLSEITDGKFHRAKVGGFFQCHSSLAFSFCLLRPSERETFRRLLNDPKMRGEGKKIAEAKISLVW